MIMIAILIVTFFCHAVHRTHSRNPKHGEPKPYQPDLDDL